MENSGKLPVFICPGVQKSGTTYLYNLLRQNDSLCFSPQKETQFFSHDKNYEAGIKSYFDRFNHSEKTKYIADFSQSYLPSAKALNRIKQHLGDNVKMVVMLRDPVKRAFSNYKMLLMDDRENRPFHDVMEEELRNPGLYRNIGERGLYEKQLDKLFSLFNEKQICIYKFEDFISNPESTLTDIFDFLDIAPNEQIKYNVGRYSSKNRKLSGIGKKLYYSIKSSDSIIYKSRLVDFFYRVIIFITRKKLKQKPILEQRTADLLSKYYKESNAGIFRKYDVDTRDWS